MRRLWPHIQTRQGAIMAKAKRDRIILGIIIAAFLCLAAITVWAAEVGRIVEKDDRSTVFWALGGLQTIQILLLGWIKLDIKDLWKRANSHGHSIDCEVTGCKPKTTGVLIQE